MFCFANSKFADGILVFFFFFVRWHFVCAFARTSNVLNASAIFRREREHFLFNRPGTVNCECIGKALNSDNADENISSSLKAIYIYAHIIISH